jgi:hypothetical protein
MKLVRDKDNVVQITVSSFWTGHATSRADARADSLINKTLTRPRNLLCVCANISSGPVIYGRPSQLPDTAPASAQN